MPKVERSQPSVRLEARVSPEIKALWQKAAACKVLEQHQTLKLNREDSEAFVNALLNPPQPNDALKAAALRYL